MNIRDKFLNESIKDSLSVAINNRIKKEGLRDLFISKLERLRKAIKHNGDKQKSPKPQILREDLDTMVSIFNLNIKDEEHINLIIEIINNSHYVYSGTLDFHQNVIIVSKADLVNNRAKYNTTKPEAISLIQLNFLTMLDREQPLRDIAKINGVPAQYNVEFKTASLFPDLPDNLTGKMNFSDLVECVEMLNVNIKFTESSKHEREKILGEMFNMLKDPNQTSPLLVSRNGNNYFNAKKMEDIMKGNFNSKETVKELVRALAIHLSTKSGDHGYCYLLDDSIANITSLLKDVSPDYIERIMKNEYDEIDDSVVPQITEDMLDFIQQYNDNEGVKGIKIVKSEKGGFLDFENGLVNILNAEKLMTVKLKDQQIITYFLIECFKENKDIECKLFNNKTIKFGEFESAFYLEKLLKDKLTQYPLNDILEVIHSFKKDKIFKDEYEAVIDNVIAEKFVKKFSYNQNNTEIIFINEGICVFNENLISKIKDLSNESTLELYILSQDTVIKELGENIKVDKNMVNLKKYQEEMMGKIKCKVSDEDIERALISIEKKSNTLIKSKGAIHERTNIALEANTKDEPANYIVVLPGEREGVTEIEFIEKNYEKMLSKNLTKTSTRELSQVLVVCEAISAGITFKNKEGKDIRVHKSFEIAQKNVTSIYNKLDKNVSEYSAQEVMEMFAKTFGDETYTELSSLFPQIKRGMGIKGQLCVKSIL